MLFLRSRRNGDNKEKIHLIIRLISPPILKISFLSDAFEHLILHDNTVYFFIRNHAVKGDLFHRVFYCANAVCNACTMCHKIGILNYCYYSTHPDVFKDKLYIPDYWALIYGITSLNVLQASISACRESYSKLLYDLGIALIIALLNY